MNFGFVVNEIVSIKNNEHILQIRLIFKKKIHKNPTPGKDK